MSDLEWSHVQDVCRIGEGRDCCAYLAMSVDGFQCAKSSKVVVAAIEKRLAEGSMEARGDNCSGPPDYKEDQ